MKHARILFTAACTLIFGLHWDAHASLGDVSEVKTGGSVSSNSAEGLRTAAMENMLRRASLAKWLVQLKLYNQENALAYVETLNDQKVADMIQTLKVPELKQMAEGFGLYGRE